MNEISPLDYEVAAQFAHFFTAAFLVGIAGRFGAKWLVIGVAGMTIFATLKEFWWDEKKENPLVRGSSILDFVMYMAGTALSVVLWFVL